MMPLIFKCCEKEYNQFKYQLKLSRLSIEEFTRLLHTAGDEHMNFLEDYFNVIDSYNELKDVYLVTSALKVSLNYANEIPTWLVFSEFPV